MAKLTFGDGQTQEEFIRDLVKNDFKTKAATYVKTAFIFALAELESQFGFLWDHDSDSEEITDEQARFEELYEKFRKRVLDNGNNQIRFLDKFIDAYEISMKEEGQ